MRIARALRALRALGALQTLSAFSALAACSDDIVIPMVTGSLEVRISGLPAGVAASVLVTGPGGFSRTVTATTTIPNLPVGTYTVAAAEVTSPQGRWAPTPATQEASVTVALGLAVAAIEYAIVVTTPLVLGVDQVVQGLTNPVYLTAPANDPRLFIVEQPGRIRVFKNGALLATPFLDITSIVRCCGEEGLLSVAFDPAYSTNGRFYVYYNNTNGDISVARYTASPTADVANAGSRTEVITIAHPGQSNHNGGLAMFGPDGMLYLGTGDGGGGGDPPNNAQNTSSLLGKLLRLNVTNLPYTIPPGNPFVGVAGADEIWAYGLRNPWRYSFDATAGALYIADVGQGAWEEVNAVSVTTAGVNYGWRRTEGTHCYPPDPSEACNKAGLTLPVHEYDHGQGCSITGGFVYRGAAIPELTGHYLYSDYCTGFLRSFRLPGGPPVDHRTWAIGSIGNIASFGVDAAGEMYMLSSNGSVYRIVKR